MYLWKKKIILFLQVTTLLSSPSNFLREEGEEIKAGVTKEEFQVAPFHLFRNLCFLVKLFYQCKKLKMIHHEKDELNFNILRSIY